MRLLASGVIAGTLFLQTVASFHWFKPVFGVDRRKEFFWPLLDYPMYSRPHQVGEPLNRYRLFGMLDDGREVEVTPADLGLNFWKFDKGPVRAMLNQDADRLAIFVAHYARRHGRPLARLRLENHPWVLTERGAQEASRAVIADVVVSGNAQQP